MTPETRDARMADLEAQLSAAVSRIGDLEQMLMAVTSDRDEAMAMARSLARQRREAQEAGGIPTLRDHFACSALIGSRDDTPSDAVAAHCYAWADAMLMARRR